MEEGTSITVVRYSKTMLGRDTFDCGIESLNQYIAKYATQNEKRNVARVFVALNPNSSNIVGYYSLNATSIPQVTLPEKHAKGLFRDVPAVLLGRLAVDKSHQKKGLGLHLMMNAFERICEVNNDIATQSLVVDAIDESAAEYYRVKFNFQQLIKSNQRLFLPLTSIQEMVNKVKMD